MFFFVIPCFPSLTVAAGTIAAKSASDIYDHVVAPDHNEPGQKFRN